MYYAVVLVCVLNSTCSVLESKGSYVSESRCQSQVEVNIVKAVRKIKPGEFISIVPLCIQGESA